MGIQRVIEKEFGLPVEQLRKSIHGDLLALFGVKRDISPNELACGLVLVEGYSYGGGRTWSLSARSAHADDSQRFVDGDEDAVFGSLQVSSDTNSRIEPVEALLAADEWIRTSQNTEFVPDTIKALPVPQDMATCATAGLILVRASNTR